MLSCDALQANPLGYQCNFLHPVYRDISLFIKHFASSEAECQDSNAIAVVRLCRVVHTAPRVSI